MEAKPPSGLFGFRVNRTWLPTVCLISKPCFSKILTISFPENCLSLGIHTDNGLHGRRQCKINNNRQGSHAVFFFSKMTICRFFDVTNCFIQSVSLRVDRKTDCLSNISALFCCLYKKLYYVWTFHIFAY